MSTGLIFRTLNWNCRSQRVILESISLQPEAQHDVSIASPFVRLVSAASQRVQRANGLVQEEGSDTLEMSNCKIRAGEAENVEN